MGFEGGVNRQVQVVAVCEGAIFVWLQKRIQTVHSSRWALVHRHQVRVAIAVWADLNRHAVCDLAYQVERKEAQVVAVAHQRFFG